MQGYVNQNYEAMLSLVVRNGEKLKSITAVIDTGFTGFLSLPISVVRELELSWSYRDRAMVAKSCLISTTAW
jgi:predicted aspartyl protease